MATLKVVGSVPVGVIFANQLEGCHRAGMNTPYPPTRLLSTHDSVCFNLVFATTMTPNTIEEWDTKAPPSLIVIV